MKRFGMYNNDFNNLFECYSQVNTMIVERELPSVTRVPVTTNSGERTFPGLKYVKIFTQKPSRGADMTSLSNVSAIESDDGKGGVIITSKDGDRTVNVIISTADKSCHVKISGGSGEIEDEFITTVPVKFDSENKELSIINIQEI